jgi:hypothetical protein
LLINKISNRGVALVKTVCQQLVANAAVFIVFRQFAIAMSFPNRLRGNINGDSNSAINSNFVRRWANIKTFLVTKQ